MNNNKVSNFYYNFELNLLIVFYIEKNKRSQLDSSFVIRRANMIKKIKM